MTFLPQPVPMRVMATVKAAQRASTRRVFFIEGPPSPNDYVERARRRFQPNRRPVATITQGPGTPYKKRLNQAHGGLLYSFLAYPLQAGPVLTPCVVTIRSSEPSASDR